MRTCTTIPDVTLRLYELSGGLRFLCTALQDGPSDIVGILRLMEERLEECAACLDDLPFGLPSDRSGGGVREG